jgi:hypothetical protein
LPVSYKLPSGSPVLDTVTLGAGRSIIMAIAMRTWPCATPDGWTHISSFFVKERFLSLPTRLHTRVTRIIGWRPLRVEHVLSCQPMIGSADFPRDLFLARGEVPHQRKPWEADVRLVAPGSPGETGVWTRSSTGEVKIFGVELSISWLVVRLTA